MGSPRKSTGIPYWIILKLVMASELSWALLYGGSKKAYLPAPPCLGRQDYRPADARYGYTPVIGQVECIWASGPALASSYPRMSEQVMQAPEGQTCTQNHKAPQLCLYIQA